MRKKMFVSLGWQFRKYPEQWQQIFQAYGPEDPKTKKRPILTKARRIHVHLVYIYYVDVYMYGVILCEEGRLIITNDLSACRRCWRRRTSVRRTTLWPSGSRRRA